MLSFWYCYLNISVFIILEYTFCDNDEDENEWRGEEEEEEELVGKEQTEEETLAMDLLDKIKIAGGEKINSDALYSLDRDLEKTPDDARLAEDVTAENP